MNHFDPCMKKAWLILLIAGVLITILPSTTPSYSAGFLLIGIVGHALSSAWVVFLLNKLATEGGLLKSKRPITIWGYIWRALIVYYISMVLAALTTLLTIGVQAQPSILTFFFISALQSLFCIAVIWCIFSKDRKSQIRWVLSLSRGF